MNEYTRRDFIWGASAGVCALGMGLLWPKRTSGTSESKLHEAKFYDRLEGGSVRCRLCPKKCVVPDGERGYCEVRENRGGSYYTLVHSRVCAYHNDPIGKKPFHHFLPRTMAFSIATAGCNLDCRYCQNWQISQARPEEVRNHDLSPRAVVDMARARGAPTIAYTYTEPVVFYEYMYETASLAKKEGLRNVMVSNGYIEEEPLRELCDVLDAVKVDLKSFSDDFYREICGGELQPVLDTLLTLKKIGIWYEIVVLLVPTLNDSDAEIDSMTSWIVDHLGPDVPVTFSRFYPSYKLVNVPPTPVSSLERAVAIARKNGVGFAYGGNIPGHKSGFTYCPKCGRPVIKRIGPKVLFDGLKDGRCRFCGRKIPGVWT
jgi:pyruvate formate lyase activating enzyme